MKLPKGVRLGVGLGCIGWSFVYIPYAIIKYINEKEVWVLYFGLFAGFLALLTGLVFLIFFKSKEPSETPKKEIHAQPISSYKPRKVKKNKKPFISEEEWGELEEEDEEAFYIEEMMEDDDYE